MIMYQRRVIRCITVHRILLPMRCGGSATCLGAFYRVPISTHIPEYTIIVESMKALINLAGVAGADPKHRAAQLYLMPTTYEPRITISQD